MRATDGFLLDFKRLVLLGRGDSPIPRLDPRAKVLTTLVFAVCVISFDRYELSALLPFCIYPLALAARGGLPAGYLLRKLAVVAPFAVLIGIFNPVFDRQVMLQFGPLEIWAGSLSCATIIVKTLLTAGAAIILVAVTGFPTICSALARLGLPDVFTGQLHFLYRYLFVLADEGGRMHRASQLRAPGGGALKLARFGPLAGHLLLRSWGRAERVHMAMLARGGSDMAPCCRDWRCRRSDLLFLSGWSLLFMALRFYHLPRLLGRLVTGELS
jgi:cobalt/nickel transport system permease protein